MNMLKKCLALVLMMILLPVWSCFASDSVFIRIDRDDPAAGEKELALSIAPIVKTEETE